MSVLHGSGIRQLRYNTRRSAGAFYVPISNPATTNNLDLHSAICIRFAKVSAHRYLPYPSLFRGFVDQFLLNSGSLLLNDELQNSGAIGFRFLRFPFSLFLSPDRNFKPIAGPYFQPHPGDPTFYFVYLRLRSLL